MKTIINTLKAIILIACIITLSSENGWGAPNWQQSRYGAVGFNIGSSGYIGTGYGYIDNTPAYKKDFWEYNPATDSWTQKADFGGEARQWATSFSLGDKGYVGTGQNGNTLFKDFWEYNPVMNAWTKKADLGGVARKLATGFSISTALIQKGYVGTGLVFYSVGPPLNLQDLWEYDPATDSWLQKADFPGIARYAAVGFSIGEMGYLGTGINYVSSTENTVYKDFYAYDPVENTWTRKADLCSYNRAFAVGFRIGNKGYIGTGNSMVGFLNDFLEYDPAGDTWVKKANFGGTKRDCATGFSIGTKGYIGTGLLANNTLTQDFWEFNQASNVWTQKTDLGKKHKGSLKDLAFEETDQVSNEELVVYPNPSTSTFNFRLATMNGDLVTIQIYDLLGRLVSEYKSLSPDNIMTIGEELDAGMFIAVVTQGEYRKSVKINKVK